MQNPAFENINLDILIEIQDELRKQDDFLFNEKIASSFQKIIPLYIDNKYPRLKNESKDIKFNVERRLKNIMRKFKFNSDNFNLTKYFNDLVQHECELALPNETNKKNNLGLTKQEFNRLKSQLQNGDETIVEKVYLSQFKICLTYLIKSSSCTYEEAYECSMDALYEIRKDLLNNKILYGNLASYYNRRAKLVFLNKKRKPSAKVVSLEENIDLLNDSLTITTEVETKEIIVKEAISKLSEDCKKIIKQFYYQNIKLEEIAIEMNKSNVAIRKQISRCRNKMRSYLAKAIYNQDVNFNG